MNNQKTQVHFLLVILLAVFVLTFLVFKPFIYALVLGAVFATAFEPLHKKILLQVGDQRALSALLTMLFVAVVIFTPLTFLGIKIFEEAGQLYFSLSGLSGRDSAINFIESRILSLEEYFPVLKNVSIDLEEHIKSAASWMLDHFSTIFSSFAKFLLSSFVFLMALYYFLKDGDRFKNAVKAISPLTDTDDEIIIQKLKKAVDSVLRGNLIVALAQGILASVGFVLFGVPNPILWGSLATIAALIPGIGTALVILPAAGFLFLSGETVFSIALLAWGVVVVGLIDNFLRPQLIGRSSEMHPLLVLLSVLGGLVFFGPLGFLLGPLVLSLLIALFDTHTYFVKNGRV